MSSRGSHTARHVHNTLLFVSLGGAWLTTRADSVLSDPLVGSHVYGRGSLSQVKITLATAGFPPLTLHRSWVSREMMLPEVKPVITGGFFGGSNRNTIRERDREWEIYSIFPVTWVMVIIRLYNWFFQINANKSMSCNILSFNSNIVFMTISKLSNNQ